MRKVKSAFLTRFSAGNICIFTFYRQGLKGVFCKRGGKWCLASFRIRLCECMVFDTPACGVVDERWTMGSVKPQVLGYRGKMSELFGRKSDFSLEMSELFWKISENF